MRSNVGAAEYGPVPLLLGVVGHRKLPRDTERLKSVVRDVFRGFQRRYPSTQIVLLSALAEGADRLVAREALGLGLELVVPLPLDLEEYERDFATEESRTEFRALLGRAERSFVVPPVLTTAGVEPRDAAYANCGAYIVRRCVELIALWDGNESPHGGTADIVGFQLDGIPSPYVPGHRAFDPSLCGPVVHVSTPRGPAGDAAASFEVKVLYPPSALVDPVAAYSRAEYEIERFNQDATRGLFERQVRGLPIRRQAEVLATVYQRLTTRSLTAISTSVFFAVVAFNLYVTIKGHPMPLLVAYAVFTAAAFVPYLASRKGEWQLRYQDYRALEQVLRTDEFWRMAGVERSVASQYAKSERTKVDWIAIALGAVTEPIGESPPATQELSQTRLQRIYDEWVMAQYRYFTDTAGRRERKREHLSSSIVTVGVVLSIALTLGSRVGGYLLHYQTDPVTNVLLVATLLGVIAALVHDYAEKRGWSEHSRHYELMAALFSYAASRIEPLLRRPGLDDAAGARVRAILVTLGEEAIRENLAWLNLHRSRPLNVPRA